MRKISFCPGILYIYALIILFIVAGVVILVRIFFPDVWTIIFIIMLIFYFFVEKIVKIYYNRKREKRVTTLSKSVMLGENSLWRLWRKN